MAIPSNYANGFEFNALVRELMNPETTTGKNFYVGNHASLLQGEKGASDNNRGTFLQPFSTLDYAIGQCKANRGDRIYLRPNHTETISAAASVDIDVIGVTIVGMGSGTNRPTFNYTTSTSADIDIDAANVTIFNCYFDCTGVDANTGGIDVNAAHFTFVGNEVLMADSGGQASRFITTDSSADNMRVIHNICRSPNAGAQAFVRIGNSPDGVEVGWNHIYGDFSDAGIFSPSSSVPTNVNIHDNYVQNDQSGDHAIELQDAVTGVIRNNYLVTDAIATALDPGSCKLFGNEVATATDSAPIAFPPQGTSSTVNSAVALTGGDVEDVFTVTNGPVLVHMLAAEITTVVSANASLIHFESDPTTGASNTDIAEGTLAPDIASAAVGDWFAINGDSQDVMKKHANGTDLPMMENQNGGIVVPAGGIDLKLSTSDPTTGAASIYIVYTPLVPGAYVA